jgi:mRNA interferase MazF
MRRTAKASAFDERAGLCVLCPTTNQSKRYPFEVEIPTGYEVTGVVLADQVKSLSWPQRNAQLLCRAPDGVLAHTKAKIKALMSIT